MHNVISHAFLNFSSVSHIKHEPPTPMSTTPTYPVNFEKVDEAAVIHSTFSSCDQHEQVALVLDRIWPGWTSYRLAYGVSDGILGRPSHLALCEIQDNPTITLHDLFSNITLGPDQAYYLVISKFQSEPGEFQHSQPHFLTWYTQCEERFDGFLHTPTHAPSTPHTNPNASHAGHPDPHDLTASIPRLLVNLLQCSD